MFPCSSALRYQWKCFWQDATRVTPRDLTRDTEVVSDQIIVKPAAVIVGILVYPSGFNSPLLGTQAGWETSRLKSAGNTLLLAARCFYWRHRFFVSAWTNDRSKKLQGSRQIPWSLQIICKIIKSSVQGRFILESCFFLLNSESKTCIQC